TQIFPNCVLEKSEIGAGCNVGPFARMRPGGVLDDTVHIGNLVEVKKSRIGRGSEANDMAYLRDGHCATAAHLGARATTCDDDGATKRRTVIGEGAFIGSGNMLVAPVTIGDNATTAAGSTITKNAPPGKLTVARARQITIEGWQRPAKRGR